MGYDAEKLMIVYVALTGPFMGIALLLTVVTGLGAAVKGIGMLAGTRGGIDEDDNPRFWREAFVLFPGVAAFLTVPVLLAAEPAGGVAAAAALGIWTVTARGLNRRLTTPVRIYDPATAGQLGLMAAATIAWAAVLEFPAPGMVWAWGVPFFLGCNYTLFLCHVLTCREAPSAARPGKAAKSKPRRSVFSFIRPRSMTMSTTRLSAVILILAGASAAWMILGQTLEFRTATLGESLNEQVESLWGPADVVQNGPAVAAGDAGRAELMSSQVRAQFDHANRYKGLLWFSTYTVKFAGTYGVSVAPAPGKEENRPAVLLFALPEKLRNIEDLRVTVDGDAVEPRSAAENRDQLAIPLAPGPKRHTVAVAYVTRGRDRWTYRPTVEAGASAGLIRDLTVTMATNFEGIDYPSSSVSPTEPAKPVGEGMEAVWKYTNTRSKLHMGIEMPKRPNAGPVAARMSYFAPVSLFFFFTVLFTVVVLKKLALHPTHYLFIAAGFFAFHILLSYLVDIINLHAAFWICAGVSVFLVVSYMRLVAGIRFAATYVAAAQLVYLVGFSYAFFWAGRTGLTVTIGAIATLFVLMQATGKVNWHAVFARPTPLPPPVPTPPPTPPIPAGH